MNEADDEDSYDEGMDPATSLVIKNVDKKLMYTIPELPRADSPWKCKNCQKHTPGSEVACTHCK
jgi:hypothetical protein